MFAALGQMAPKLTTRRALVVLNMQNDSFGQDDLVVCNPTDFMDRCKTMIPHWRKLGDVIWIKTEFAADPPDSSARSSPLNDADSPRAASVDSSDSGHFQQVPQRMGLENYFASHRQRAKKRKEMKSSGSPLNDDIEPFEFDIGDERIDEYLKKPRKGQLPDLYRPGTRGADFCDAIAHLVEKDKDVILTKHHYSGFDATSLLMTLRMKFITHIYLCGCFSNVSIYETAADAARHGFEVTVVEDCMGYRSAEKHLDAMRKMADFLGASGIDSEEIIAEAAGQEQLDADESMIIDPVMGSINAEPSRERSQPSPRANATYNKMEQTTATNQIEIDMAQKLDLESRSSRSTGTYTPHQGERPKKFRDLPLKGPGDLIGEGDSSILYDALSNGLSADAFKLLKDEVDWQVMNHRSGEVPRRVAVQGQILEDGSVPVYRHPADESPPLRAWSKTVRKIREEVQRRLKQPFNHVLIQLYRDGSDNISEHSDKTLDVVRGSSIINVSFGAERRMTLRTKKSANAPNDDGTVPIRPRLTQTIPMPHNSIFVLGWRSNMKWLHGVRPDKRPLVEKTPEEKAYSGERISLTFRHIGTFISADSSRIWGQGAGSKFQATAGKLSSTDSREMEAMVIAFGKENQQSEFDWDAEYGRGFDVMNLVVAKSTLFLSNDEIANLRVKMSLQQSGIPYRLTRQSPPDPSTPSSIRSSASTRRTIFSLTPSEAAPTFRDVDPSYSEVTGDLAIIFYLHNLQPTPGQTGSASSPHSSTKSRNTQRLASNAFARTTQANELLYLWQELRGQPLTSSTRGTHHIRRLGSEGTSPGSTPSISTSRHSSAATGATSASPAPAQGYTDPARSLSPSVAREESPLEAFDAELSVWEEYARESEFIACDSYAVVDCAFWPVLNDVVRRWEGWSEKRFPKLANYWKKVGAMESTRAALAENA